MQPLDCSLNVAILTIASHLFPTGYDVSVNAPSTYSALCRHLNSGRRMAVSPDASDTTIYADVEVNYAFRAWHDWCHWTGGHDFSLNGERRVWRMMCQHLVSLYGRCSRVRRWCRILYIEVVSQRLYYETHHSYLHNQRAFVEEKLRVP